MLAFFKRKWSRLDQRRNALSAESADVDGELQHLQGFLRAAPHLREEARMLIPPPEEFARPLPDSPNRADLRRAQRQSYWHGFKLLALLTFFLIAAVWFTDRLLTVLK